MSYASTSEIPRSSERIRTKEDPKITPIQNILWTETKKTEIIIIIIIIIIITIIIIIMKT